MRLLLTELLFKLVFSLESKTLVTSFSSMLILLPLVSRLLEGL